MPITRLKRYLDSYGVHYSLVPHYTAYTASGIAAAAHIPGRTMAKPVMIVVDGLLAMFVLPATTHIKLRAVKIALGARDVYVATEREFAHVFPDCEVGAMPPFGNLYNIPVYVDETLTRDREIVFNAGTHREAMRIAYSDFARLAKPLVLNIATLTTAERHREELEHAS